MLEAMGLDFANLHSVSEGRADAIKKDLGKRKVDLARGECRLQQRATEKEFAEWKGA